MKQDNDNNKQVNQTAWILNYQPTIYEQHIHMDDKPAEARQSDSTHKGKTVPPKRPAHFLETATFRYAYSNPKYEGQRRLTILFQLLCKEYQPAKTWIDPKTAPDDFLGLFTGELSDKVIVWAESKQKLYALFKRMKERKIISTPKGYGIWKIVENHFSDWHGNMFLNLNKEHMPEEPVYSAINTFIDLLDPGQTTNADLDGYARKTGTVFGNR